ncbi:hypothetical protein GCM10008905_09500 [Clostridium malenominatum]|uniref:4Fe-4S ferredoxin-type domain-containing protein n=1 Tax=Clostridium malenominatum TaxID=1539 RepID=A0ABP3U1T4_9CLOT
MNKKLKKKSNIRLITQIILFIVVLLITINHTLAEKGGGFSFIPSASLHAICPFGGVESIYRFITVGSLLQKIHESSFVLMFIGLVVAAFFGAVFCGWLCPFGSIQEWIGKIGRKLLGRKYNSFIPYKYDKYLRYLRYLALAWVIYITAVTGKLAFSDIDPYSALFHLWTDEVALGGIIILIIVLIDSLFIERPWCKYLCPYGAILGITNKFRIFKIRRHENTCISCNACNKSCPMNINVASSSIIKEHQCIACMKCTSEESCPVKNTVEFKINKKFMALTLIVLFFGGIEVSKSLDLWQTESSKVPVAFKEGAFKGEFNPADIRGSYSFSNVSQSFDIPLNALVEAFVVDEKEAQTFKNKDLETKYANLPNEIGTGSVRLFVALYKGLPYDLNEDTYLLEPAVKILKEKGSLTEEQIKYIDNHVVNLVTK